MLATKFSFILNICLFHIWFKEGRSFEDVSINFSKPGNVWMVKLEREKRGWGKNIVLSASLDVLNRKEQENWSRDRVTVTQLGNKEACTVEHLSIIAHNNNYQESRPNHRNQKYFFTPVKEEGALHQKSLGSQVKKTCWEQDCHFTKANMNHVHMLDMRKTLYSYRLQWFLISPISKLKK